MSYTEFLRTKLASQQKIAAIRTPTDASHYIQKQRMSATRNGFFADGTSVGNLVKSTDRPVLNNATVSSKKASGKSADASDFTVYQGSGSSWYDLDLQAKSPGLTKNLLCVTPASQVATTTTTFNNIAISAPFAIAVDSTGNLYVANYNNDTVTVYSNPLTTATLINTISGVNYPFALAFDSTGNLYVGNRGNNTVTVYSNPSTTPSLINTISINTPSGIAFDSTGNLYVSNNSNNTVTVYSNPLTTATLIKTISGINTPYGIAFDSTGNLYVANYNNNTVTVYSNPLTTATLIKTISSVTRPSALAFDSTGNLYVSNVTLNTVTVYSNPLTTANVIKTISGLVGPYGIAFDSTGNLYVSNNTNNTVTVHGISYNGNTIQTITTTQTSAGANVWKYSSASDYMRSVKCKDNNLSILDAPGDSKFRDNTISLSAMHPAMVSEQGDTRICDIVIPNHTHSPGIQIDVNSQPYALGKSYFMANPPGAQGPNVSPNKVGGYLGVRTPYVENKHGYVEPTKPIPIAPGGQGQEIAHLKINQPTLFQIHS